MQDTWVQSLGWEDPLEKGTATRSSILAWRSHWTEEPGRLNPASQGFKERMYCFRILVSKVSHPIPHPSHSCPPWNFGPERASKTHAIFQQRSLHSGSSLLFFVWKDCFNVIASFWKWHSTCPLLYDQVKGDQEEKPFYWQGKLQNRVSLLYMSSIYHCVRHRTCTQWCQYY